MAVSLETGEKLGHFFLLIQKHELFEITSIKQQSWKIYENIMP